MTVGKNRSNSFARMAITIRVGSMTHHFVLSDIREQPAKLAVNNIFLRTNKFQCPGLNALRTLSSVAHNKNRLAEARRLLLNTARISEYQIAISHKVMKIKYFKGINNMESIKSI